MSETMLVTLSNIRTVEDMVTAFRNEEHCRRLLESIPMICCLAEAAKGRQKRKRRQSWRLFNGQQTLPRLRS